MAEVREPDAHEEGDVRILEAIVDELPRAPGLHHPQGSQSPDYSIPEAASVDV